MTRPRKSVSDDWASLRGAWTSVATADLPSNVNMLVVDGEVQDLGGVHDLPGLELLELHRWARPLHPLAGHPALSKLILDAAGGFGSPAVLGDLPALEVLSIGVDVDDALRLPALMDQIPWSRLTRLRHVSLGVTGSMSGELASHDLAFLADLERIEVAAMLGSVLSDPDARLTRERLPGSLRELRLIERTSGELDDATTRLAEHGINVTVLDDAHEMPHLPWPPPGPAHTDENTIEQLINQAVGLENTVRGWTLRVLGSGLPAEITTSQLGDLLAARLCPTVDVVVDAEASELTILGRDLQAGVRWEEAAVAIMEELWGL